MKKPHHLPRLALALMFLAACSDPTTPRLAPESPDLAGGASKSYILLGTGNSLPADLAGALAAAGGALVSVTPQIGMAVATSEDPGFASAAAKIPGLSDISDDPMVQWVDPSMKVTEAGEAGAGIPGAPGAAGVGDLETFRLIQWAPDAISAPAAWNAGHVGTGARVAILDGGIHAAHIDIAPNLDVARSASFVPGQPFNVDVGTFWHGTHVAGIVAAAANNIGTVGIAPGATLVGVKVLHNGSGAFSWVIQGMIYASTPIAEGGAGADIINMSLGATFLRQGVSAAGLASVLNRAANYATQQGTLVIAALGNSAVDLDHTANVVFYPAQASNVVAVSAHAPMGWAVPGGTFDLDRPASYTNFGQSAVTVAAPGGDFALPGSALCSKPRVGPGPPVTVPCWVFDMVMSTCRGSGASIGTYCWAAGTSMASPAAAGVAALIVGRHGRMQPGQLGARLRASADDLGKPGNDDYYGRGRVNAWRAVQ